jgi:hypothetical protein
MTEVSNAFFNAAWELSKMEMELRGYEFRDDYLKRLMDSVYEASETIRKEVVFGCSYIVGCELESK